MMKYLLVEESANEYHCDRSVDVFDDLDDANRMARVYWRLLSPEERMQRYVYVIAVTEEDLPPHAFYEDGSIDWRLADSSTHINPWTFDSTNDD